MNPSELSGKEFIDAIKPGQIYQNLDQGRIILICDVFKYVVTFKDGEKHLMPALSRVSFIVFSNDEAPQFFYDKDPSILKSLLASLYYAGTVEVKKADGISMYFRKEIEYLCNRMYTFLIYRTRRGSCNRMMEENKDE